MNGAPVYTFGAPLVALTTERSPFAIRALSDILKPSSDPLMPIAKRQRAARPFVPLTIRFDHALLFAAQVHRNQDRKRSGIPYLSHLLGVAAIVLDYGGDEDLGIAALLHDAAEDHGGRAMLRSIEQLFGPRVAKIVDGCTDSYGDDEKSKPKWYPRKLRYLRRVRHEDAETRFAVFRIVDFDAARLQNLGDGKDITTVIIHDQNFFIFERHLIGQRRDDTLRLQGIGELGGIGAGVGIRQK